MSLFLERPPERGGRRLVGALRAITTKAPRASLATGPFAPPADPTGRVTASVVREEKPVRRDVAPHRQSQHVPCIDRDLQLGAELHAASDALELERPGCLGRGRSR